MPTRSLIAIGLLTSIAPISACVARAQTASGNHYPLAGGPAGYRSLDSYREAVANGSAARTLNYPTDSRVAPVIRTTPIYAMIPPSWPLAGTSTVGAARYATPSPYYYGIYGYPSTYYMPTNQTYGQYAQPGMVATSGFPVFSVTYGNGATLSQAYTGYGNATPAAFYSNLGYPSYSNNRSSYGADLFPGLAPGQITNGQSTQAAMTPPGYYANYVVPPGATYEQIHAGTAR